MYSDKFPAHVRDVIERARELNDEVQVIVRFHSEAGQRDIGRLTAGIGAIKVNQEFSLIPATALSLEVATLDELSVSDDVAEIWLDEVVHILLDVSTPHIRAPQVWEQQRNDGEGVTICIVDTGIDATHPDFAGRVGLTADFSGKGSAADGNGHGTHVASIAAGTGAASGGKYIGVAPGATIMAAKALADNGSGRMSNVMAGLEWAAQNGADVLNLSLGSRGASDGSDALSTMCNAIVDLGKVMVVAAWQQRPPAAHDRQPRRGGEGDHGRRVDRPGQCCPFQQPGPYCRRTHQAGCRRAWQPDRGLPRGRHLGRPGRRRSLYDGERYQYVLPARGRPERAHAQGRQRARAAAIKKMLMATSVNINISESGPTSEDKYIQGDGRIDALTAAQYADTGQQPPPHKPSLPVPAPPSPNPAPGCMAAVLNLFRIG